MEKKYLTIYSPYYNQPELLKFNFDLYSSFKKELLDKAHFMIVDDGSQVKPAYDIAKEYTKKLDISLYKIDVDIPWNMPEANNIAFKEIKTPWVLRTDMDHFLDEKQMLSAVLGAYKQHAPIGYLYFFGKRFVFKGENAKDGKAYPINQLHENSYIIHKDDYWRIGGYNECYSGNYGWDDVDFFVRAGAPERYKRIIPDLRIGKEFFKEHNLDGRMGLPGHIESGNISEKLVEQWKIDNKEKTAKAYAEYEAEKEISFFKMDVMKGGKTTNLSIFNNPHLGNYYNIDKYEGGAKNQYHSGYIKNMNKFVHFFNSLDRFKHTYTKLI